MSCSKAKVQGRLEWTWGMHENPQKSGQAVKQAKKAVSKQSKKAVSGLCKAR